VSGVPFARGLAREVAAFRDTPLAPEVEERALALLRDYLGVAIGGACEESTVVLRRGLGSLARGDGGTILGTRERLPPAYSALANGAAAHALEMDDTHQAGSIHLGATMFSAALAAAELRGGDGSAVLRAAVAGYEVAGRLARAVDPGAHYRRGFHPTATCGAFGAAATAGALFGLDEDRVAAALGVAGSQAAGSMEFLADGSWTKRFHPGWAAFAGLHAAALAEAGFRAPATIFEGRFGFLHAYSDAGVPSRLLPGDGPELCRTSVKPHACCRYMQGPIDATLGLRAAERFEPTDVARVEVGMLAAGVAIVCEPAAAKRRPANVVDAQFSLPFGIAVALARGSASPAEFSPATLGDPLVLELMDRVVAVPDAALDARFPAAWPCWVRVALRDGRRLEARVDHPRGDPENFPVASELEGKFRALAGRTLGDDAIARLAAVVDGFPRAQSVAALLAATVPSVG
jgi:2-methylcitrate dehydratase PrpD